MNDVIEHHGVKGQRWGVRKQRVTVGKHVKNAVSSTASKIKKINTETAPARLSKLKKKAKRKDIKKWMSYGVSVVYSMQGNDEAAARMRKTGRIYSRDATRLKLKVSAMQEKYNLE